MTPTCYRCRSAVTPQGRCACRDGICLVCSDCREVLSYLEAGSVDCVVTDPPYGLGFMGKDWDHGVPGVEFWRLILAACKPGAPLLAFGGTRTFHRLACAIEDAGWELRDTMLWLYGQGFPKSLDISKAIDKEAGAERIQNGINPHYCKGRKEFGVLQSIGEHRCNDRPCFHAEGAQEKAKYITAPATEAARLWHGYGTALKPAYEPITLAMKPLDGTFANNALKHGVAGLNVDACRVATGGENPSEDRRAAARKSGKGGVDLHSALNARHGIKPFNKDIARYCEERPSESLGRFPANLILSHAPECKRVGVKKVKGTPPTDVSRSAGVLKYGGQNARPYHGTYQRKTTEGYADADGTETVEAWECADDCPIRIIEAQAGEPVGRFFATVVDNEDSFTYNQGNLESVKGESSCTNAKVGLRRGGISDNPTDGGIANGEKREVVSNTVNLNQDGCGNKPTDQSPTATKSTTGTTTKPTTESRISNSLQQSGTTTITNDCEKTTNSSRELKSDDASGASNTRPSANFIPEKSALTADIAKSVPETTCENGGSVTANITTPIIEHIARPARTFYCPKASKGDRGFAPGETLPLFGEAAEEFRNTHPTVKPLALMRYLATLLYPPSPEAVALDPFAGSGTTGVACKQLGRRCLMIELEEKYCRIALERLRQGVLI